MQAARTEGHRTSYRCCDVPLVPGFQLCFSRAGGSRRGRRAGGVGEGVPASRKEVLFAGWEAMQAVHASLPPATKPIHN